jgi:outer membrane lipoprotein SlyB
VTIGAFKPGLRSADTRRCDRQSIDATGSMTMLGMIVGSTLGGIAPMLIGGGLISSLVGSVIGGGLGIWAGLRIKEWIS